MIRCSIAFIASVFCTTLLSRADVVLIRDGEPVAQLVLTADADGTIALAASELNYHLKRMSGAMLPVVREPFPGKPTVYLGAPGGTWAGNANLASLVFDGFVVEATDNRLVLAGKVPDGALNAVYWLLEELGVRWYIPTDLGLNLPVSRTVTIPAMHNRVEPAFACRKNHGIERSIRGHGDVWQRRVRITDMGLDVPFNRYSHNLANIVRIDTYADTHPEYFPWIDGRRRIPAKHHSWQPCTSNPEVVALAIRAAHDFWEAHPEANVFSLGVNDGAGWCECESCTALDIPGSTFRGREVKSERYFTFVKQVAEAVRETHPGKWLTCIAYANVEPVPRGVALPGNVMVVITQDVGAWHDPAYRAADEAMARAWAEAAGAFGVYNYTSQMWLLPRSYPHLMGGALRFYDSLGAVAVTNESWPTWWYAGPMMYARAKLMWNPQQDIDAVLDDYYAGFFGPAHLPMKRLYERFEQIMMTERPGRWFYGISSVPEQVALWTPPQLRDSRADLDEAKQLADEPPYRERVRFVAEGFALTDAILREYWECSRVRELAHAPNTSLEDLVSGLDRLAAVTATRRRVFDRIMADELISGTYDRLIRERGSRLSSWKAEISSTYAHAMGTLCRRATNRDATRLRELAAASGEDLRPLFDAFVWVLEHPDAENLCPNPGFEQTTGTGPAGSDWVTRDAPPGWAMWSIDSTTACFDWLREGGRDGAACAAITGAKRATFIARVPVTAGERYYTSVWIRSMGTETQVAELEIKWQRAGGGWVRGDANQSVSVAGGKDTWQQLSALVEVPEGAERLVLLPRASQQTPDDVVLFDDARVVRVP